MFKDGGGLTGIALAFVLPALAYTGWQMLATAGYITVEKGFRGKMPRTVCRVTPAGTNAMTRYVKALKSYLKL